MGPSQPSYRFIAAAAAAVLATGLVLHRRNEIASYYHGRRGMSGILRMIWEGDHLPPHVRESMDELDRVQERMVKSEEQLEIIEVLIERARLESVDGLATALSSTTEATNISNDNIEEIKSHLFRQHPELRTRIGIYSNKLDTLASIIDSVLSHSDEEVKQRKKGYSDRIVELMDELDRMIHSLQLVEVQ